jgi:hypothetical protein
LLGVTQVIKDSVVGDLDIVIASVQKTSVDGVGLDGSLIINVSVNIEADRNGVNGFGSFLRKPDTRVAADGIASCGRLTDRAVLCSGCIQQRECDTVSRLAV